MDFKKYGTGAMQVACTAGGAIAAGFARKKISFLDTIMGKILLLVVGIAVIAHSKSEILKGVATGIALNGAMGLASSMGLEGVEGVNGVDGDGVGAVVQDENGMVYMVNGVGEALPYQIPVVEGIGSDEYLQGNEELAGLDGRNDMVALA